MAKTDKARIVGHVICVSDDDKMTVLKGKVGRVIKAIEWAHDDIKSELTAAYAQLEGSPNTGEIGPIVCVEAQPKQSNKRKRKKNGKKRR